MLNSSHQRDPSVARGRNPPSSSTKPPLPSLAQRALSPQAYTHSHDNLASLASRSGTPTPGNPGLERRPSTSYGHHRQTSVVPTNRTHSRQNSSVQSPAIGGNVKSPPIGSTAEMGYSALPIDAFEFRSPQTTSQSTFQPFQNYSSTSTLIGSHTDHSPSISESISSTIRPYKPHAPNRTESASSIATVSRKASIRPRRDHGRSGSNESDEKTVGEYALQHLFKAFTRKADAKIDICITKIPHEISCVEEVCGVGVDPEFDALIQALGHISRQRPKPLVDTAMLWRGMKAAEFQDAQKNWKNIKGNPDARGDSQLYATLYERVERADKRVVVAIYLICRILMQVYSQCEMEQITPYLDNKIEDLLFEQLSRLDPDKVNQSNLHKSNWIIYSQLLGLISMKNFQNVSARFMKLLGQVQQEVGPKGAVVNANSEQRVELVVRAMSYLCIRTSPEAEWHQSVDMLLNVSRLFAESHGQIVKRSYCSVLETLISSVMTATPQQFSGPRWKEVLSVLSTRLAQLVQKPRYWAEAFPLSVLLVCASPNEVFNGQWSSVVNGLQAKFKDPTTRSIALQSICRLVWMYLHRSSDPIASMRKLEDVVKIVLPSGKKTFLSTEPSFADPTVEFIRLVGYRFPEFCFKNIVFPLLNSEMFASGREIRPDQLEPQRMVIAIRAFLAVITDLEATSQKTGDAPRFPSFKRQNAGQSEGQIVGFEAIPRIKSASKLCEEKSKQSRHSQPVQTNAFGQGERYYYNTFCEILGKITLICDNAFGGQATLDEKLSANGSVSTPKTPLAGSFTFSRQDDHTAQQDIRQGFYDLLHVAVKALPRFMSSHIPFNQMINLLCTGTAHPSKGIASSSANSLKAIARQSHSQQVTIGFARFIFNFDVRYSTMSDEALLGPTQIQDTLRLYLELLKIWIEEIQQKTKDATPVGPVDATIRPVLPLEVTSVSALVEEIESHGIFFLCSQSRRVRSFAVQVLRIVTEFDRALTKDESRVINILSGDLVDIISPNDNRLTVAERSRLQKGRRKSSISNGLIELCSSEVSYDSTLWFKVFPNLIAQAFSTCPFAIALGREIVCARLLQMRTQINAIEEAARQAQYPGGLERAPTRPAESFVFIEQWKLYLIMACTTMANTGGQTQSQLAQHVRNKSRPPQSGENFMSARSLFAYMIPLLGSASASIREAVVTAMGSINSVLYRTLLESLQYAVTSVNDEAKAQARNAIHQRAGSVPRSRRHDDMRTETTHVYKLTSRFLHEEDILKEEWIVNNLIRYTDDMRIFLSDAEVQNDWYFQSLRRYYCGLLEEVFEGVNRTKDPTRWMTFEARKAAFTLIEDWCGYSPNQPQIAAREENMKANVINSHVDNNFTASIEIEKRNLRMAALSAMASLCAGPISIQMEKTLLTFDARRMLEWIDQILGDPSDKMHAIGRRAMKNLIKHNTHLPIFLERVIDRCIPLDRPKAMESYFDVVYDVLSENKEYNIPFWRIVGMLVITLGSEKGPLRTKSVKLLRLLEEHYLRSTPGRSSKLQNFDISVSDKTTAVYKLAQYRVSDRLSKTHTELVFFVFSQFCLQFKTTKGDYQRNIVAAMLPWVQALELEVDTNGAPTQQTYMVLSNLLEITTRSSAVLHNEVQALWQALANGSPGNVQLILNFVITLCMERREQSFVDYARQIVVYLSSTGQKVVDFLLLQITPKNMVQTEKPMQPVLPNTSNFPYVADLTAVLPIGGKQQGFSLGQLSLILMVDLVVSDVKLASESVPLLLQICSVLWDHHFGLVQEQAREMLVHLIHELVINKFDEFGDEVSASKELEIEEFVEMIRQSKPSVVWQYADNNANNDDSDGMRVPDAMKHVTSRVIDMFSLAYPEIHEQWAKVSLSWATSCSVRHLACRSFQIFRCVFASRASLDGSSLADILARLSNTVADETPEVQGFAMEILCTLKTIIQHIEARELLKFPQLFYVTCACLSTVNEREFIEVLRMLDALLDKFNLGDPAVLKILSEAKPKQWSGDFDGLLPSVYKGLKSAAAMPKTMDVIIKTASLPDNSLIGEGSRFLFAILSHLPAYMNAIDTQTNDAQLLESARTLASTAEIVGRKDVATVLYGIANKSYSNSKDVVKSIMSGLAQGYFPKYQVQCLIFLMGILSNKTSWCKFKTLDILQVVVPEIDLRSAEVISYGSDLISPLLRLLQTEYCPPALDLMDIIMKRNPAPVEPQNLRMSMILTGTQKVKKEYEKTKSLYGIPDESGWSVPMPAALAKTTRENVHAVFYTCAALNSTNAEPPAVTPDIEFDSDDYQDRQYFGMQRSDTMMSEDTTVVDAYQGRSDVDDGPTDLAARLKSLDDLFDDDDPSDFGTSYADLTGGYGSDTDAHSTMHSSSYRTNRPVPPARAMTSLSRNPSVSSLHNPRSERAPMNPAIMTPGAFFESPAGTQDGRAATSMGMSRPTFHSRSVTSPSHANHAHSNTMQSVHEFLSDDNSDEDLPTGQILTQQGHGNGGYHTTAPSISYSEDISNHSHSPSISNTMVRNGVSNIASVVPGFANPKRARSTRQAGIETKQGDLLRGGRTRSRSTALRSPEVPKVPEAYLQEMKSPEL